MRPKQSDWQRIATAIGEFVNRHESCTWYVDVCATGCPRIGTRPSGCGSRGLFSRPFLYACSPPSPRVFRCLPSLGDDVGLRYRSPCQSKRCGDRVAVTEVSWVTCFVSADISVEKNMSGFRRVGLIYSTRHLLQPKSYDARGRKWIPKIINALQVIDRPSNSYDCCRSTSVA